MKHPLVFVFLLFKTLKLLNYSYNICFFIHIFAVMSFFIVVELKKKLSGLFIYLFYFILFYFILFYFFFLSVPVLVRCINRLYKHMAKSGQCIYLRVLGAC